MYFRTTLTYLFITVATLLLFDVACYVTGLKEQYFPTIQGRLTYPDGYFVADEALGHDIKRGHPPVKFSWHDAESDIFSNQYGCFDKHESYQDPVVYLAGDSVAWGYADYEKKFGYIIEQKLKWQVAKCGVTHSGQKHQLQKLKNWIGETGITPRLVISTWVSNDPENDFLFPQATVIDGKFVDQVRLANENDRPVRKPVPEIKSKVAQYKAKENQKQHEVSLESQIISFLKTYSTLANLARTALTGVIGTSLRAKLETELSEEGTHIINQDNLRAIKDLIDYALHKKISLLFLTYSVDASRTAKIHDALMSLDQHVVDYPEYLKAHGISVDEVKWPIDGHPNEKGNEIIARVLLDHIFENELAGIVPAD